MTTTIWRWVNLNGADSDEGAVVGAWLVGAEEEDMSTIVINKVEITTINHTSATTLISIVETSR